MASPSPVWKNGKWTLDLRRPWDLGRHVLCVVEPPPIGTVAAIHAAYALLAEMQAKRAPSPQLELAGTAAGPTVDSAVVAYEAERAYRGTSGIWLRSNRDLLKKELAGVSLAFLATREGLVRLARWRDEVRARGIGARSMKDRLNVFRLMWRWAAEPPRQWVALMPVLPSPKTDENEVMHDPVVTWIDHPTFRAVRGAIYDNVFARTGLANELRKAGGACDAAAVHDLVCRRQLYLSFAFYTGMRRGDLNRISDAYLSPDMGCYFRHGRKTGVEVAAEAVPKPFQADIAAELRRLGRSWRPGELICGGPWFHATRVIRTAARKLGVQAFDLMTCRRSFVYYKALGGVLEPKLVNLMGHSDSKMIHSVYLVLQPRLCRDEAGAAWGEDVTALPGTGDARIIPFDRA
jgi:integrase